MTNVKLNCFVSTDRKSLLVSIFQGENVVCDAAGVTLHTDTIGMRCFDLETIEGVGNDPTARVRRGVMLLLCQNYRPAVQSGDAEPALITDNRTLQISPKSSHAAKTQTQHNSRHRENLGEKL